MTPVYLFDVDGTLTPSRGVIDPEFKQWFLSFVRNNRVSLVTGSDFDKTIEQVGFELMLEVEYHFACLGNLVYSNCTLVDQQPNWKVPPALESFLTNYLNESSYPHRCGNHIEKRIGMVNFSVVGRNATKEQRADYYKWDLASKERKMLAHLISEQWSGIQAVIGGEISIDIFPTERGKKQVLRYFPNDPIIFFGDKTSRGENDYDIAQSIIDEDRGKVYSVSGWEETWKILQEEQ
jgi:phosphomannomutase